MAKKKTTDAAPPASRRRTARSAGTMPPVDGIASDQATAPEPISAAADAPRRGNAVSDTPAETAGGDPAPDDIAREAYLRYLRRGGDHGRDFDDWLEAERELRSRR
jgi:hypothetical protein